MARVLGRPGEHGRHLFLRRDIALKDDRPPAQAAKPVGYRFDFVALAWRGMVDGNVGAFASKGLRHAGTNTRRRACYQRNSSFESTHDSSAWQTYDVMGER